MECNLVLGCEKRKCQGPCKRAGARLTVPLERVVNALGLFTFRGRNKAGAKILDGFEGCALAHVPSTTYS